MDTNTALAELGLSQKEIDIYLILLASGESTLQQIAKKTSIVRTTVYNSLNTLSNKGLVSKKDKNKIAHYEAASPKKLKDILERKKKVLDMVIPNLEQLQNSQSDQSSVEVFYGPSGIFSMYSDVFEKKEMKYWFGNFEKIKPVLKHFMPAARNIRIEREIPAKIIIEPNDDPIFHTDKYRKITEMRQTPLFDNFPAMIFVYGNKVAIYSSEKDIIAFVITNSMVAKAMKLIFDLYWIQAKKFKL